MATLQKIRGNKVTQFAIGLGMVAFIAGSAVEIMKQSAPDTEVVSLNGKSLDYAEFNQMVEDYKDVLQLMGQLPQGEQVSNEIMAQIREQVYQDYLREQLMNEKCEKLGLTITDNELQNIIKNGQHPLLAQTPFRTQQGQFDYAALQQFLKQRDEVMKSGQVNAEEREQFERIYRFWLFIEKQVRKSSLEQKYAVLTNSLIMTNPIAAKANFDARTQESTILMAGLPYYTIADSTITVTDKDIQAKYDEYKENFYQPVETRDIKYIDLTITATQADREALQKEMEGFAASLEKENANVESVVRQSQSAISYSSVAVGKNTLPTDIAGRLDSMEVGTQTEVFYTIGDNTLNIVKLLGKTTRPDSVEVRQLVAANADAAAAKKTADSIVAVLNGGEPFDSVAKHLNQPADKQWVTSSMIEGQSMNDDNKKYVQTITTAAAGSLNTIDFEGGVIVAQVTDRRSVSEKFDVAVIKRTIDFSNETATDCFNALSTYLANNKTVEEMEAAQAQGGYAILTQSDIESMQNGIQSQMGPVADSREVVRWAFKKETKVGEISDIMYCGKNREHLMVAVLTAINPKGYRDLKDEQLKTYVKSLVIADKKAAMLQDQLKGAKTIEDVAKMKGAVSDTIQHVNFAYNTSVRKIGGSEAILSGAACAQKGQFVNALRGNSAVYAIKVLDKNTTKEEYNEAEEMKNSLQMQQRSIAMTLQSNYMNRVSFLYNDFKNAKLSDKRHLFY